MNEKAADKQDYDEGENPNRIRIARLIPFARRAY
jgi:hypothetical protein